MKAALIARYGSNDLVKVADTAVPVIGSMDLLVQVHAASVNPVDVKTRDGQLKTLSSRGWRAPRPARTQDGERSQGYRNSRAGGRVWSQDKSQHVKPVVKGLRERRPFHRGKQRCRGRRDHLSGTVSL